MNSYDTKIPSKLDSFILNNQLEDLSKFLTANHLSQNCLNPYLSKCLSHPFRDQFIQVFLKGGADVNSLIESTEYKIQLKDKKTLLMFSIITNNTNLFSMLMTFHPNISQVDSEGKNVLAYSILYNDEKTKNILFQLLSIDFTLLNEKIPIKEEVHNLLTLSALKNKKYFVEFLIKAGINVNFVSHPSGNSALHFGILNDNVEIVEMIYNSKKCNRGIKNNDNKTPKTLATELKGKVFYSLFSKNKHKGNKNESKMNSLINMNDINIDNDNNVNNNVKNNTIKKCRDFQITDTDSLFFNLNNFTYQNKSNKHSDKHKLTIPVSLQKYEDEKLKTYLCEDQIDIKVDFQKNQSEMENEIKDMQKTLEKLNKMIDNYKNNIDEKDKSIAQIQEEITKKTTELNTSQNSIRKQRDEISELKTQIEELNDRIENSNNSVKKTIILKKFESNPYNDDYIIQSLQKDLLDYQNYVNEKISLKRPIMNELLKKLQDVVDEVSINKQYKVTLYGSYSTGLCLPWSDMDVVIVNTNNKYQIDDYLLSNIYIKLTQKSWVLTHKFIKNTRIPIIKLVSNDQYNFHIDISAETDKHFGLKCVELVKGFLSIYPMLLPIVLALKTILYKGNLNNPYTGGLSSYGLLLMVVSFIQSQIDNKKLEQNSTCLGETFINFLGHFGIYFDYSKYIIMVCPPNDSFLQLFSLPNQDSLYQLSPLTHELIILDPLNSQNNVARTTFQFMNIKMAFMISYMVAKEDCECGCHYYDITKNKLLETEHFILKRIFNSVQRFSNANSGSGS